jgi:hypothetical protein
LTSAFASILLGNSIILQSDTPLPVGLDQAVRAELSSAGLWQSGQGYIYVKIHGPCHITNLKSTDVNHPMGWVDRVDGEMLSIIHVDCSRIGEALCRIVVNPQSNQTRQLMARAIARVIRHEWHHLTLNTANHEKEGDYKASLRAEELAAPFQTSPPNF